MRVLKIAVAVAAAQLAIWGGLGVSGCLETRAVQAGRAKVAWSAEVHRQLTAELGLSDEQATEAMETVICTEGAGWRWQWVQVK